MLTRDQFRGCILGLAVGDSLGAPTEFLSMDSIKETFGRLDDLVGWRTKPAGSWTDDTEMMIAIANGLLKAEQPTVIDEVMTRVSHELADWYTNHDLERSPGTTCTAGAKALHEARERGELSYAWRTTGAKGYGCGALMRVAPVGLVYQNDLKNMVAVPLAQAVATHAHHGASDAAVAGAVIIANAPLGFNEAALRALSVVSDRELRHTIKRALRWYHLGTGTEYVLHQWHGWDGVTCLGACLFLAAKHQEDYETGVIDAINSPGDSDSLGAVTGAFLGARHGIDAIPARWLKQLEACTMLDELAIALWEKAQGLPQDSGSVKNVG